jgi:hypothetical protein
VLPEFGILRSDNTDTGTKSESYPVAQSVALVAKLSFDASIGAGCTNVMFQLRSVRREFANSIQIASRSGDLDFIFQFFQLFVVFPQGFLVDEVLSAGQVNDHLLTAYLG